MSNDSQIIHKRGVHSDTIETPDGVTYICPRCANVKNVFLKDAPTEAQMTPGGRLNNGLLSSHPWMQQCKCATGKERVDVQHILMELHRAMSTCKTLDEAVRLVWKLASQEEMES
jgi:hypothetical protein